MANEQMDPAQTRVDNTPTLRKRLDDYTVALPVCTPPDTHGGCSQDAIPSTFSRINSAYICLYISKPRTIPSTRGIIIACSIITLC